MLASVFARTLHERWRGVAVAVASLALMLLLAMAAYREIDLGVYDSLPDALRTLMGIPPGADLASLAFGVIFSSYGALAMGGMTISIGAAAIAGEEAAGTIGTLLGNPVSRAHVLLSKAASLVALVTLGTALLWGAGLLVPLILDVNTAGLQISAFSLHFALSALFYGFLALAVGAWTGSRGLASGVASGVMVVSFFAVGLLPFVPGWEDLARAFPWYYLGASEPLLNGVDWAHVAVLAGSAVALLGVALVGINRRDLRSRTVGVTLLDRLRANPTTRRLADRIGGSARVSRIWVKTASEHQVTIVIVAAAMFWMMGVAMGPLFNGMNVLARDLGDTIPESLLIFFGGGDLTTPEGWFQIETFGMMAPLAVILVTVAVGAKALAGEEERRTIALLLGNPVSRRRVVAEKALSLVVSGAIVGLSIFAGVAIGSWIGGLGMEVGNIAAASLLATLVGLVFGALALLLSAATGLVRVAIFVPVGASVAFHVMDSLARLNDAPWGRLSPFHYYLGADPLQKGLDWGSGALLAALAAALIAVAVPAFDRRDLRQTG